MKRHTKRRNNKNFQAEKNNLSSVTKNNSLTTLLSILLSIFNFFISFLYQLIFWVPNKIRERLDLKDRLIKIHAYEESLKEEKTALINSKLEWERGNNDRMNVRGALDKNIANLRIIEDNLSAPQRAMITEINLSLN